MYKGCNSVSLISDPYTGHQSCTLLCHFMLEVEGALPLNDRLPERTFGTSRDFSFPRANTRSWSRLSPFITSWNSTLNVHYLVVISGSHKSSPKAGSSSVFSPITPCTVGTVRDMGLLTTKKPSSTP